MRLSVCLSSVRDPKQQESSRSHKRIELNEFVSDSGKAKIQLLLSPKMIEKLICVRTCTVPDSICSVNTPVIVVLLLFGSALQDDKCIWSSEEN